MQVSAKNPGAANLMAHLCSELQITRTINNLVTWDPKHWNVSPGTLVTALVINTLVQRQPLYNVQHFYAGMDMPLYGDYDAKAITEADKNKHIEIVRGFSKDHQPHLKQLKFGLMVTNEGFPIVGDVTSGNQSDNVWNKKILDEFQMSFLETWDVAYVADSA